MISDDQPTNGNKPLIGLTQTNIWFGFRYPRTSATQARVTKNIVDSIFSKKKNTGQLKMSSLSRLQNWWKSVQTSQTKVLEHSSCLLQKIRCFPRFRDRHIPKKLKAFKKVSWNIGTWPVKGSSYFHFRRSGRIELDYWRPRADSVSR